MQSGISLRRPAAICAGTVFAAIFAMSPAPALGAGGPAGDGALSQRLAELAAPGARSASPAKQAKELSLAAEGPGSLAREGDRVLVEVRFDHGAAAGVEGLRAAGAKVVDVSRRYQTVVVAAKPAQLRALNGVPRVAGAREVLKPIAASTCPSGAVVSEGVQQLHAGDGEYEAEKDEARKAFGVDGSGITVGILSDSFNRASEAADGSGPIATKESNDVANGDLPGPGNTCTGQQSEVNVLDDSDAKGEDEGRAMAQIVHDVAPGSELAFATAFTPTMLGFADNIERLALSEGANADVIADDVAFFEEPFFQDGPVATAVRNVTENDGVTYLSAAANNNLFDSSGHEIASWEAQQFRDSGSCPPALVAFSAELEATQGFGLHPTHCMDFDPGAQVDKTFGIEVAPGATLSVDLQWAEPWNGVGTDLDAFLLNSTGGLIAASSEDNVAGSQIPFEFVQWENESASSRIVQLVVNRYAGGLPRLKLALLENGFGVTATEYPRSTGTDVVGPTVFGHSGTADAISVGAVPFDDSATVEPYSSRGPVTHYFGPAEGNTPAALLPEPEKLAKPDVVAADCGLTSFFASLESGGWRFCGTSAAAPHAAGVAALMLAKQPASPSEIRTALLAGAVPIAGFGPCAQGAGLVEAVGAIEALLNSTSAGEPPCDPPGPEGPVEEAREPANWGSEVPPAESAATTPPPGPQTATPQPAPRTFFRKRPPKVVPTRRRSVKRAFSFGSDETGVTFLCKVDRGRFHPCPARFVRRYAVGAHVLKVKARNADGVTDATPAVFRFRVNHVRGSAGRGV